ncbi:hypothetical protein BJ165DRAFT_1545520 [Panaeolus papilionaceus]|nr:hypothetical protein BJ165DRAFT_1545520 [Panaeolus papilionaceus]
MKRSSFDTVIPIGIFSSSSVLPLQIRTESGSLGAQNTNPLVTPPTESANPNTPGLSGDQYHQRFSGVLAPTPTITSPPLTSLSINLARNASKLSTVSEFRPPVPAAKRLSMWSSLYARRRKQDMTGAILSQLIKKTYQAVEEAITASTQTVYGAGLLRFHQFCDTFGISEEARMPASAPLLASFVAHCKGSYKGKTISTWLSGVRYWHVFNRAQWFGEDDWVNQTRSLARKAGTQFRRPLRSPVSLDHLRSLLSSLDLSTPRHAAIWAVALTSFFGCRCLGETTVKSASSFDPAFNVTSSTKHRFRAGEGCSLSISIWIPWTKTTKQDGAVIVLTSRLDELCPVKAVLNHSAVNYGRPPNSSFFAFREALGWHHMIKGEFLKFVGDVWSGMSLIR